MEEFIRNCPCLTCAEELEDFSRTLKVIAEPNRLKILCLLRQREMCVCEITDALELPQNLVSHHLRVLREEGLVWDRRDAQWVYYSLNVERVGKFNDRYSALLNVATSGLSVEGG